MNPAPTAWIVNNAQKSSSGSASHCWRQLRNIVRRYTSQRANAQSAQLAIVLSGYLAVNASAIIPPIDVPWVSARSIPSASSRPAPSSAQPSIEYAVSGWVERP